MTKTYCAGDADHTMIELKNIKRVAIMATPEARESAREQIEAVLRNIEAVLEELGAVSCVTTQTVFLRDPKDSILCDSIFAEFYGPNFPATTYVVQPPCSGAALAIEAWAVGGDYRISRHGHHLSALSYNGFTWLYCGGITPRPEIRGVYNQSLDAFQQMRSLVEQRGISFDHVVRTWLYLGSITGPEGDKERYMELNRARTDFYQSIKFGQSLTMPGVTETVYPASTGIGMKGLGMVMSCLVLDTRNKNVFLRALENPQQVPAYAYQACYSPKSPKFSRAMAVVMHDYVTTWVSGTASIINAETQHVGNAAKQTEVTIDNIEKLIARDNLARHGLQGAGSELTDLAKVRVYVKHQADYAAVREVCERRFGKVPAIYTDADVCRSDLLVEIEGVAFSKRTS